MEKAFVSTDWGEAEGAIDRPEIPMPRFVLMPRPTPMPELPLIPALAGTRMGGGIRWLEAGAATEVAEEEEEDAEAEEEDGVDMKIGTAGASRDAQREKRRRK